MVRTSTTRAWLALAFVSIMGITAIAWQNNPAHTGNYQQDTLPKQHHAKEDETIINGDLDKAIEDVERAQEKLQKQLQHKDWEKIQRDVTESVAKIDVEKMQEQLAKAMKQIDMQKIQLQMHEALKQIDWQKIQATINRAQEEMNNEGSVKMQKNLEQAMESIQKSMERMKTVDMEKMQREMNEAQQSLKINEGQLKENIEKITKGINRHLSKDFKKEFEKAGEGMELARSQLQNYKSMLIEMEQDGLLETDGSYHIEYNDGTLLINGKKQPDSVINKYKHYFKKGHVTIRKVKDNEDDRTIDL